jgi:hypothetical protein
LNCEGKRDSFFVEGIEEEDCVGVGEEGEICAVYVAGSSAD